MKLTVAGVSRPILFSDCQELVAPAKAILAGWPHTTHPKGKAPVIRMVRTAGGYTRTSPWLDGPKTYPDPVNAVCDLIVDVINAYIDEHRDLLCLHAAAVDMPAGLFLLLSDYEGGKSTLAVRLMARGHPLYTDDVVPLDTAAMRGMALGVLPRLRQPAPTDGDSDFDAFIAARPGPASERFRYLTASPAELLPFGTAGDIAGVVVLRREAGLQTALTPLAKGEALKRIILRNFARHKSAADILDELQRLIERTPCYTLAYDRSADAAAAMEEAFSIGPKVRT